MKKNGYRLIKENAAGGCIEQLTKIMNAFENDNIHGSDALINIINTIQKSNVSRFLTDKFDLEKIKSNMIRGDIHNLLFSISTDLQNKKGESDVDVIDNIAYRISFELKTRYLEDYDED